MDGFETWFFVFSKTARHRLVDFIDEIGVEELLKNASVEDFVRTARSLSLEQYDGSTPFESHPEIMEVTNWSSPSSRLSTYLYFLVKGVFLRIWAIALKPKDHFFSSWFLYCSKKNFRLAMLATTLRWRYNNYWFLSSYSPTGVHHPWWKLWCKSDCP